jgi:ATP-dependent DNA helicase RecQ
VARAEGVPPYVVASDRTLREIASLRPRSLGELTDAHGIGPRKAERYGAGFLAVVARHLGAHGQGGGPVKAPVHDGPGGEGGSGRIR